MHRRSGKIFFILGREIFLTSGYFRYSRNTGGRVASDRPEVVWAAFFHSRDSTVFLSSTRNPSTIIPPQTFSVGLESTNEKSEIIMAASFFSLLARLPRKFCILSSSSPLRQPPLLPLRRSRFSAISWTSWITLEALSSLPAWRVFNQRCNYTMHSELCEPAECTLHGEIHIYGN